MRNDPQYATVAEAAILTGKSKSRLYQLIEREEVDWEYSSSGRLLRMAQLRRVLDNTVYGRPPGSSKYG